MQHERVVKNNIACLAGDLNELSALRDYVLRVGHRRVASAAVVILHIVVCGPASTSFGVLS
eukprot:COSAG06_NODE_3644_length_5081_cov_22.663990_2_plen_61_part_00